MRGVRVFIWIATIGAIVLMFWPLVAQMLTTLRLLEPGYY